MPADVVSSRSTAPQLPPLRCLSFYPSHVFRMAITGIDKSTITAASARPISSSKSISRPLPQPPLFRPATHHHLHPASFRTNANYNHVESITQPHQTSSYCPNGFMQGSFIPLLQDPNVLHALLCHLEWLDAYNLFTSCKPLSAVFQPIALRDVVLSHFIPEYAQCLRNRNMQFYKDIPVTVFDLDRLLISQRVPLHRYPIHVLTIQSSMLPTLEDDKTREKLLALTQAHSRFVLLLQSLVHSSLESMPQEAEEGTYRPRFSPIHTLRELTFPAPLAYSEPPAPPPKGSPASAKTKHARHKSAPTSGKHASYAIPSPSANQPPSPRPSADVASSMISNAHSTSHGVLLKKGRRLSLFGKKSAPPPSPPPPNEPRALRVYASSWRKTSYWGSYGDVTDELGGFSGSGSLKRPQRLQHRRLGSVHDSSDSSISNPSPLSQSRSRMSMVVQPEARASSPHDLVLATSRVRAPILRVFVPCSRLEADSDSLVKCEQQLVEAGLWEHLSTGDIICNLGFVPPLEDSGSTSDGDDPGPSSGANEFIMMRSANGGGANLSSGGGGNTSQKWLLFNGHVLVPYTPPDLLPLDQPLNLPTPFYYAHIMPPFTNLSYVITQLPVCDDVPQLTLLNSTKKVRSPHSPNGHAMVKKYSWIARVVRMRTEADREMGEGWFGEWVLEGEGTPEGKQLLINAFKGLNMGHREWELVREKSGGGKLWFRLLI